MKELDKVYAQNIANEYAPKTDSAVVALKKLDKKAKQPAKIFGYTFGVVSTLIFGTGMCLCLGAIEGGMLAGVAVGLLGALGMSINYPIYQKILKNSKEKYANDIIALAKTITD